MTLPSGALSREEIIRVIEGKGNAERVPAVIHFWINSSTFSSPDEIQSVLDRYPCDVQTVPLLIPQVYDAPEDDKSYRWSYKDAENVGRAFDAAGFIEDWDDQLDLLLNDFPSADYKGLTSRNPCCDGRYRLGTWWYFFFERFWSIRGMEDALIDFYESPEAIHAFFRKLTDFYKRMLVRGKKELNLDGVFTSDDLGTQASTFFSTKIFDEFFYPYYKEVVDCAHELGMHFWLHTCGNIEEFLPRFIDLGIDVIHPIQKYTMDEKHISEKFGDKICIWSGFDVQQTIPYGTPEDVRKEARYLIDTYKRDDGRFMLTLGNNATPDTPKASLEALLDEIFTYGKF